MPGHKRNMPGTMPSYLARAAETDITEIEGFDDLHAPSGVLLSEMRDAAAFYGTADTFFSVNGSTACILAAVSAAVPEDGTAVVARNCHRSVYHALYLRHIRAVYVLPQDVDAPLLSGGPVHPADLERALSESGAAAVILTSPTYDGLLSDIPAIAAVCRKHHAVLIVDEAHGAHLGMHDAFPFSAVSGGADLVIQSLHKTMPALTQTALLHNVSGRIAAERLQFFMDIYETSSPSYLLLSSITACLHFAKTEAPAYFARWAASLKETEERIGKIPGVTLFKADTVLSGTEGGGKDAGGRILRDPSKLCIAVRNMSGGALADALRRCGIETEMAAPAYVLAMTSPADTPEAYEKLVCALAQIAEEQEGLPGNREAAVPAPKRHLPEVRLTIAEVLDSPSERTCLPLELAEGYTSASFIDSYPPGIPLIVPGEVIPQGFSEHISRLDAAGTDVRGCRDGCVSVLADLKTS